MVPPLSHRHLQVCLDLTRAIGRTRSVDEIYAVALEALAQGLGVERSSILLFDADGVMRFKAYRGLSATYRRAVEGHTPWAPDSLNTDSIVVPDIGVDASLADYRAVFLAEGIAALAFIPLVIRHRVIGKFMLYADARWEPTPDELQVAEIVASQVAFALERTRAEDLARRSEERLRFALDAASMGTWDWDIDSNTVEWSENLARMHRLPPGTYDGTFASYEREIHPDDRQRVMTSIRRALEEGAAHDVEYRILTPDGETEWVEGKGHVQRDADGRRRMTGVCMLVTRRKEAELARLAAAEEASRLKDEFLATLSHELRTPMNAVLGWVQLLNSGRLPPTRIDQALEVIGRNARLQAQLVEDLLDVSRIVSGKLEIEREPVSVKQVIDHVVGGISPAADAKRIHFTRDLDTCPEIVGDAKRLEQVVANVLSNAVKFTPDGGRIDLRCKVIDGVIEIEVQDDGVGIAPEFLPYVFDRFRQADSRSTRLHGGLGLGLAIARHLLQLHGGEIEAHSDGVGRGTTVRIRVPVTGQPDLATSVTPARGIAVDVHQGLDGTTIAVVDDEPDSREVVGTLLEGNGARVYQCADAASAIKLVESSLVQLLVADLAMPVMDGYELIRRVRSVNPHVPAVAVSAYARIEDRNRALDHGYNGYCAKPIDTAELMRVVRDVIRSAQTRPPLQLVGTGEQHGVPPERADRPE